MNTPTTLPETTPTTPAMQEDIAILAAMEVSAKSVGPKQLKKSNWLIHLALILVCGSAAAPFIWMLSTSLKTADNAMAFPPQWIPYPIQWRNYLDLFNAAKFDFLLWTRNTLIIVVLVVCGTT